MTSLCACVRVCVCMCVRVCFLVRNHHLLAVCAMDLSVSDWTIACRRLFVRVWLVPPTGRAVREARLALWHRRTRAAAALYCV